MPHAVILSGAGAYADPWHPFARTSDALAEIVSAAGCSVEIDTDVDSRLAHPGAADLLVVNIGRPNHRDPATEATGRTGLLDHLGAGRPVLAVHSSITSLPGIPEWRAVLGGTWRRGTTMHPPKGITTIHVADGSHVVTRGMPDFEIDDERYSFVDTDPEIAPLITHRYDGRAHPLAWFWRFGAARTAVDLLGHDETSYAVSSHRLLITRVVRRLLDPAADVVSGSAP